jgi:hypothetical protein
MLAIAPRTLSRLRSHLSMPAYLSATDQPEFQYLRRGLLHPFGLLQLPATGAVIDARGIRGSTALTCPTGTTPWNNSTTTVSVPSTILLPATGGTTPTPIVISSPWILPLNTHLIGEGDGIPIYSSGTLVSTPGTTIQAKSGFSGIMIQLGSSSVCSGPCTGISDGWPILTSCSSTLGWGS